MGLVLALCGSVSLGSGELGVGVGVCQFQGAFLIGGICGWFCCG